MSSQGRLYRLAAAAVVGASALVAGGAAQARDVFWSVGVGSPGVQVNASNAPQLLYPRPVVVVPQPVYYTQPAVVYQPPQVVYQPPQVVYGPPVVVYGPPAVVYAPATYYLQSGWTEPGYRHGWRPRHRGRHGHWDQERWDRGDDRHGFDGGQRGYGRR